MEAISQAVRNIPKALGYPYINSRLLCYFLSTILCQGLECVSRPINSNKNLPTWIKQLHIWTLLFTTIRYFGDDHLPYAILALFILILLVLAPTALLIF